MSKKKKKRLEPRTIQVVIIDIVEVAGKRVAQRRPARIHIDHLFAGLELDPAARVKNLRHLQSFFPRHTVEVHMRGEPPKHVPLNRIRLDPTNSVGDQPHLPIIGYGTISHSAKKAIDTPAA